MNANPLLLLLLSACGAIEEGTACIDVDEDTTTCPAAADVDVTQMVMPMDCDHSKVKRISGEGALEDMPAQLSDSAVDLVCCYTADLVDPNVSAECDVGRPIGALAELVTEGEGTDRARAWAEAALAEHASIAAFARLALELLAHGAPLDLVRDVLAAADDEVRHAEQGFAMAARFGLAAKAGALAVPTVQATRPLAEIARDAVRDGCLVETVGAHLARVAAHGATEPDVRSVLTTIADDEARHAALSWRVVAWAARAGGAEVRDAVRSAFTTPIARPDVTRLATRAGVDAAVLGRALDEARDAVVRPAARVLLAA